MPVLTIPWLSSKTQRQGFINDHRFVAVDHITKEILLKDHSQITGNGDKWATI